MNKWILAVDAAKMLCCHTKEIYKAAKMESWEYKLGKSPKKGDADVRLYLTSDVMRLKKKREKMSLKNTYAEAIDIVNWADSLSSYPSLGEIKKKMTEKYRVKDIMSVIENRPERGLPKLQGTVLQ